MLFQTLGNPSNPPAVLIHGMFCNGDSCLPFAQPLSEHFYVILPTLDGHYAHSTPLGSVKSQAEQIVSYLHQQGISQLAMLQGTSMGAEVALATAAICDIPIQKCVFDGGPFFHFPKAFRSVMCQVFRNIVKKCQGKDADVLLADPFIRKLGGKKIESYRPMLSGFHDLAAYMDAKNLKAVTEICYNCILPDVTPDQERSFVFLFSQGEPARKSRRRLMKKYPNAVYQDFPGDGHCGFQTSDPEGYADYLRETMAKC